MSHDLRSDLTADLLRDLSGSSVPAQREQAGRRATPTLSVVFTPLRWSRVSVASLPSGTGVSVVAGPWSLELVV